MLSDADEDDVSISYLSFILLLQSFLYIIIDHDTMTTRKLMQNIMARNAPNVFQDVA